MSARRALRRILRHRAPGLAPPVFWGRIGAYEAVTRQGVLLLLAPEPTHPSRRATGVTTPGA